MNQRKIVKQLIFFAKREFREKRPFSVQVLRVKGEQVLTKGGPLKELVVRRVEGAFYLVLVDYKETIRIYYYSIDGKFIDAQNLEKTPKLQENIKKGTVREFYKTN
ncbi:MAG: hypothetical protein ACFFA4_11140 [Promethearchaeota archaeon]